MKKKDNKPPIGWSSDKSKKNRVRSLMDKVKARYIKNLEGKSDRKKGGK